MPVIIFSNYSGPSSDIDKWVADLQATNVHLSPVSHHSPPSYIANTETLTTISSESTHSNSIPTSHGIKPSNFVSLTRANESIRGSWFIDPSLSIPSSFLPELPPDAGTRKNLFLESKNGIIDADVYLPSTSHSNTSKFILIHTQSSNGSVITRLHDTKSSRDEVRPAVRLFSRSSNGSIHVQLPRSFRGPIRVRGINGSIQFSAAMQAHLTSFFEIDGVQRSFLGHFDPSQWEIGTTWEGDELSIETRNGNVRIAFDDEGNV